MTDPIPLGGLKFSEELALIWLSWAAPSPGAETEVLRALAGEGVNLFYLSVSHSEKGTRASLCVAAEKTARAERLAAQAAGGTGACRTIESVGLLTFYPHEQRLEALRRSLAVFTASRLPVFGIASSLSALTFVTAFAELDRAGENLRQAFGLPPNHAPFRPEFRVKPVTR